MSRGSNLHRTKEGREKLNFTKNLKKKQDEKKYQKNQNQLRNNESSDSGKKKTSGSRTHVMYKGKKVLKTSAMGKKAVAAQKRKSLASKNYMSKEMVEKRKKRLKIKK